MTTTNPRRLRIGAAILAAGLALSACGGAASTGATGTTSTAAPTGASAASDNGPILPVAVNPIDNASTVQTLEIDSILVENNVDDSGKAVDDHLEIALTNTGDVDLSGFEVFYTFTDPTAGTEESYAATLPSSFTVPAGGARVAHFDDTGAKDHFPVNAYSLYATSTNALDVEVTVSAEGAAPQTAMVQKDAGGAETPD